MATNQHQEWLILVEDVLMDMPATTVVSTARDLLGTSAQIVGVCPTHPDHRIRTLERAGADWCVDDPRLVLHPSVVADELAG